MHASLKPIEQAPSARSGADASGVSRFVALCLAMALLLFIKYYPLKPTTFVLSQYLWTVDVGDLRRAVVSSLAAPSWHGDPARFLPVVDAVSLIELTGLTATLVWGAVRLAGRQVPRLGLLLLLCSGAVPHLLATRGSQDGVAALALIGVAASLEARRAIPAALLSAVAVAVHEASIVYILSIGGLHLFLSSLDSATDWRRAVRRIAEPAVLPLLASLGAAALALLAVLAAPHMAPDAIADICRRNMWMSTVGGLADIRNLEDGAAAERWADVCGLQFRSFSGSPAFVLRSVPLGALFAPVVLITLPLLLRARLSGVVKLGAAASLLLPAALPFVATDITRFWSYMNFTALYGLVLLEPRLQGFGRVSPRALFGAVLALWVVVAVGIDQWPTGWPQAPSLLPDAATMSFPSFRQAICAASQQGVCDKPVTVFR